MSSDQTQEISRIFQAALKVAEPERSAFITEACGNDPELRRELEALLRLYSEGDGLAHDPLILSLPANRGEGTQRVGEEDRGGLISIATEPASERLGGET